MSRPPFALYNPALLSPDDLLAEFTARLPLLETLLDVVRSNKPGHPPQHCLLIGARGMGKTTMLWAVAHRVSRDAEMTTRWQPVVFDEESRRVGDLADFWLESIRQWEHATRLQGEIAEKLLAEAGADIEDRARDSFLRLVDQSGKRALLLIDNLNDVLISIRDLEPLHRLRAFLMKDSRVMIVGGATCYFDEITSVDQPFYDFFRCFELRPLTAEEMETCLLTQAKNRGEFAIAETLRERRGTIRGLHLLTGGNPRLVKTFYRLLVEGLRGDIRTDLERLLDEFTPYFKAIVDVLPVQQQRIFDAVALAWDPVEVATLATATRLPSNQVSAQLRALINAGLVREAAGSPKRKTYLLVDRFSNIHYMMRHGRAVRTRLDWFVAMVRIVFPDHESTGILARVARQAAECGLEGRLDARSVLQSTLARTESAEARRVFMHATLRESWDSTAWDSLDEWFDSERTQTDLPEIGVIGFCRSMPPALRKQLGYKPESARWWCLLGDFLQEKGVWMIAEAAYRKAIELDPTDPWPWDYLGTLLKRRLGRPVEAESAFRKSIELDPKLILSWVCLGNLLADDLNRPSEAEATYRKAIELDPNYSYAWTCLGNLLWGRLGRPVDAEAAYRRSIAIDPKDSFTWTSFGNLLGTGVSRTTEAEVAFRKAIEIDPKNTYAWGSLGHLLGEILGRFAEAEVAYREAVELDPGDVFLWCCLADLIDKKSGAELQARRCAVTALSIAPDYDFARAIFSRLCRNSAEDWRAVLRGLVTWCSVHPKGDEVFDFAVEGFLSLASLAGHSEALTLIESLPDAAPFQTLRDAFITHGNRDHLNTLAPERQNVVLSLLDRVVSSAVSSIDARSKPKRAVKAKKK